MAIPYAPEDLARLTKDEDAEFPYIGEVDNGVEGWKAIAWGGEAVEGNALILSVQVALRRAYEMGCEDQKALMNREPGPPEGAGVAVAAEG